MIADLHVLSGARAGVTLTITSEVTAGRAPGLGLQFDPERDLDVSSRHAAIVFASGRWVVRDLGSRNGTFVNGRRVREADLHAGDRIRFGADGPEVEFRPRDPDGTPATRPGLEEWQPLGRLERANQRLRLMAVVLTVALVGAIGWGVWTAVEQQSEWSIERERLLARVDSALEAGDETARTLTGEREGLASALRESQAEVRRVRGELEQASDDADTVDTSALRRQLQSALAALDRQQLAASLDYDTISAMTRRAVAVVWVETRTGEISTGTAFAIRADGTMATSAHVLSGGTAGTQPRRVAVQFADSRQVWPARVVAVASDADIAILRVENILGEVPTVASLNERMDTIAVGTPVAWIGFPLGGETWPQDQATGRVARPLGAVGVITRVDGRSVELQGYGTAGASGSPILDQTGAVVGVLAGGEGGGSRELIAVPATAVSALLRRVDAGARFSPN